MIQVAILSASMAQFFWGGVILVILIFAYTLGVARERRRLRKHYFTGDQLYAAEMESYRRGLKHGQERSAHEHQYTAGSSDVDRKN